MKELVNELWPLHRTIVSEGTDQALRIIGQHIGPPPEYKIETYLPGKAVWTWKVPEKYAVHQAYLETETGKRIADFKVNPLHFLS